LRYTPWIDPLGAHRSGVVQVAAGVDEADDRRAPPGAPGQLLEGGAVVGDEPRLEQEVLGRVAGDRQLGEHGQVRPRPLRLVEGGQHGLDVAVEVAHHQVELAGGDTETAHRPRAYRSAPLPVWVRKPGRTRALGGPELGYPGVPRR
jgi:hypothetical protein